MAGGDNTTMNQLMELFQKSRSRGEWVSLSMESRDGKDFVSFSIRNPAGTPAGTSRSWSPSTRPKRRKTPSQWRRDERRKEEFLAKKNSAVDAKATLEIPKDEIDLKEMKHDQKNETPEKNLYKIKGEYKNPGFKPFAVVEPEKEIKTLWEILKKDNESKEIEEIGDGSTCFEHVFEFWGTWRVKAGMKESFLQDSRNWPKGIKILEVKPA